MASAQTPARLLGLLTLLGCLLCGVPLAGQAAPLTPQTPVVDRNASPQELEQQADALRAEKRYLDSLDAYSAAITKQPTARLWNKQGFVYLLIARYPDAPKCFDHAVKADKTAPEAYNNRGFVDYYFKNYSRAIRDYKRALAIQPNNATFHKNMAAAYFDQHDFTRAAHEYGVAYQLDPTIFEHSSRLGFMAQSSSPEDRARFCFMVAKLYARSGDVDHSLEYLRKAMEEGFKDINKVYTESEFASLRADKRFAELMEQKPQPIQ